MKASGGAWADYAAAQGLSVVLVARRPDKLEDKRVEIARRFGVEVQAVAQDLADPLLLDRLRDAVAGREVGFLVYNAALATVGSFFEHSLEFERQRLTVNCAGPLVLAHHFGLQMARRRRGGIVLMSSGTGMIGSPYYTHYGATKAYDIGLAEGLWFELRPHDEVVAEAIRSLGKQPSVVVGAPNRRLMTFVTRLLPRSMGVKAIGAHALKNFLGGSVPDLPPETR